jgi:hypothetical protein
VCGGTYISCWVKAQSEEEASNLASAMIHERGWKFVSVEEECWEVTDALSSEDEEDPGCYDQSSGGRGMLRILSVASRCPGGRRCALSWVAFGAATPVYTVWILTDGDVRVAGELKIRIAGEGDSWATPAVGVRLLTDDSVSGVGELPSIRARRCLIKDSGGGARRLRRLSTGRGCCDRGLEPTAASSLPANSLRSPLGATRPDSDSGRGLGGRIAPVIGVLGP